MISKKDITTLPEKKRKELEARLQQVRTKIPFMEITISLLWIGVYVVAFSFIAIPLWKIAYGPEAALAIYHVMTYAVRALFALIYFSVLLDLLIIFAYGYKMAKIREEYFNIKIEAKK